MGAKYVNRWVTDVNTQVSHNLQKMIIGYQVNVSENDNETQFHAHQIRIF